MVALPFPYDNLPMCPDLTESPNCRYRISSHCACALRPQTGPIVECPEPGTRGHKRLPPSELLAD